MAIPRVMLGKITPIVTNDYAGSCDQEKSEHAVDGLQPEGCEAEQ